MDIKVVSGEITKIETGAIVLGMFEGEKKLSKGLGALNRKLGRVITSSIERGDIKGKAGEVNIYHSLGRIPSQWVAVVGLGKKEEFKLDIIRGAVADCCRTLRQKKVSDITVSTDSIADGRKVSREDYAQAIAEGAILGLYTFRKYYTKENDFTEVKKLTLLSTKQDSVAAIKKGSTKGRIIAEGVCLARDMVNEPANYMTPSAMAEVANKIAKDNDLEINVLEREDMQKLKMGALLGVSMGTTQPPKMIMLTYKGRKSNDIDLALVGKGITFDTGGISLKTASGMEEMKADMSGGAAVLAAIGSIAQLKLKINVTSVVPAVENMPDGSAIRPSDILTAMAGKTIEIISTDAEGRLVLADALGYINLSKPKAIVDVATLTGACVVALGKQCTGLLGNDQPLVDNVIASGNEVGEAIWQLPLFEDYRENIKSDVADIKNAGSKGGGTITAALFLSEFVGDTAWAHMDIAGTNFSDKDKKYNVKGGTGVPVRTLVNLAIRMSGRGK
ncbi:MAG: leucyl aminopeptidase [Dehalococcoidales bacterium]|nr:leucyl aminopeptidase [Dehalococcoidales bacterium]